MIDGDAIKPGPRTRSRRGNRPLSERLEKNIVRRVLGLVRVAQKPERQIINLAAVRLIQLARIHPTPVPKPAGPGAFGFSLNGLSTSDSTPI